MAAFITAVNMETQALIDNGSCSDRGEPWVLAKMAMTAIKQATARKQPRISQIQRSSQRTIKRDNEAHACENPSQSTEGLAGPFVGFTCDVLVVFATTSSTLVIVGGFWQETRAVVWVLSIASTSIATSTFGSADIFESKKLQVKTIYKFNEESHKSEGRQLSLNIYLFNCSHKAKDMLSVQSVG